MSFYALTGLINALFAVFLGLLVIRGDPRSKVGRIFFLLCSSLFVWGLGYFLWMTSSTEPQAVFWVKALMLGAIFIPATYLHFVLQYLGSAGESRRLIIGSYTISAVFLVINFTGSNFIVGVSQKLDFPFWPNAGPHYLFFLLYFFMAISFAIFSLLRKLKVSAGIKKQQLIVITAGAVIGLIGGSTNFPLWYGIEIPPYGNLLAVTFSASIAYAILRHHLFNIKVLLTEISVAIVLIIAFLQMLTSSVGPAVTRIGLFIALFGGGMILIKSVRNEVSRREEVEDLASQRSKALAELEQRNKNLATLQKISRLVLDEIELKPMAQRILDEIPKQLENCRGALLNLVKGGQLGAYAISSTDITEKIYRMVGADISRYSYPLKPGFNLLHDALLTKQTKESVYLSDFISPPISKALALTLQKVIGTRHNVAVPLTAGAEPLGVMMFVFKVPKDELTSQDLDMVRAIADDMSIAIQRAEAYQKLKDANEYLAELDKLKDEFISMASHELNTPLAAIEGYLSMVLEEGLGKVDKRAKEYLQRAYDSSKRLAELILDLLNVSRIEQGRLKMKFVKCNFYDLAESVIQELQIKADAKKLSLKLEADRNKIPETWCDVDRIREVFVNLVGNAIKYTEKGSIVVKLYGDKHKLTAEVADTGRGIAKLDQKKLFQKFSQVKREQDQQHGTGLGLYISKNFIELHKGRIWVESEEGRGSTFAFEIPVLKAAPKEVEGAVLEDSEQSGKLAATADNSSLTKAAVATKR